MKRIGESLTALSRSTISASTRGNKCRSAINLWAEKLRKFELELKLVLEMKETDREPKDTEQSACA